jgi:aryl-alcohol dehydrogenase-like predicted oxidoreductase
VRAGATSPEQARNNAAAAGWGLADGELAEVDSILTHKD